MKGTKMQLQMQKMQISRAQWGLEDHQNMKRKAMLRKIPKRNIEFMDTQSKYVLFLGMNFVKGSHTMECTPSLSFT